MSQIEDSGWLQPSGHPCCGDTILPDPTVRLAEIKSHFTPYVQKTSLSWTTIFSFSGVNFKGNLAAI